MTNTFFISLPLSKSLLDFLYTGCLTRWKGEEKKEVKVKLRINREEWHGIVKVRSTKAPQDLGENNKGKKSICH